MITVERLARIQEMIQKTGFIGIRDIMDEFQVSRSSAMRDLDELQNRGIVIRQRGGALLKEKAAVLTNINETPVRTRTDVHDQEKRQICRYAVRTIQDGDCIYLDGGTTTTWLLQELHHKNVTLVTPNSYLLRFLPVDYPGKVFFLGGEYQPKYDMSFGALTRQAIEQFRFDACFMSCNGLDLETGECSVFDFEVAEIKQDVMKRAARKVLLCDSSKFDKRGMCVMTDCASFDEVYVDDFPQGIELPENFHVCSKEGPVNAAASE